MRLGPSASAATGYRLGPPGGRAQSGRLVPSPACCAPFRMGRATLPRNGAPAVAFTAAGQPTAMHSPLVRRTRTGSSRAEARGTSETVAGGSGTAQEDGEAPVKMIGIISERALYDAYH